MLTITCHSTYTGIYGHVMQTNVRVCHTVWRAGPRISKVGGGGGGGGGRGRGPHDGEVTAPLIMEISVKKQTSQLSLFDIGLL